MSDNDLVIEFVENHLKRLKALKAQNDRRIELCQGYPSRWDDPLIKEARRLDKEIAETQAALDKMEK